MGKLGVYVTGISRRKMHVPFRCNNLKGRCNLEGSNMLTWPLSEDKEQWQAIYCAHGNETLGSIKCGEFVWQRH